MPLSRLRLRLSPRRKVLHVFYVESVSSGSKTESYDPAGPRDIRKAKILAARRGHPSARWWPPRSKSPCRRRCLRDLAGHALELLDRGSTSGRPPNRDASMSDRNFVDTTFCLCATWTPVHVTPSRRDSWPSCGRRAKRSSARRSPEFYVNATARSLAPSRSTAVRSSGLTRVADRADQRPDILWPRS